MTVTLSPIGDLLAVEHWSTRAALTLTGSMNAMAMRREIAWPMRRVAEDTRQRLYARVKPEAYKRGAPSMIRVPPIDAESTFNVAVPGRPDPEDTVPVSLPVLKVESIGMIKPKSRSYLVPPVTRRHLSTVIMDDIERAVVIAQVHFRLLEAGHVDLSLKAASADYRDDIVVTQDGGSGDVLWWTQRASEAGIKIPTPKRYAARFDTLGETLTLTPRQKQVS